MTSRTSRPVLMFAALAVVAVAGAILVLPRLRMANVTLVPHGDPQRAAVAGRVLKPDGSPLAGASVTWFHQEGERRLLGATMFQGGDLRTTTADDGTFRFDAVPPTEGYAALDDAGCGHEGSSGHVLPQLGRRVEGLELRGAAIAADRWLRGRLRRPDGTPAAFVFVQARADGLLRNWQGGASSDAEGRFAILSPWAGGELELVMPAEDTPVSLGTHHAGATVELVLPAGR
ncbi:MAG: carboxypeptidase regulatory-like domain-containing protein [Planctomycetes bacterium]|nr:carboxypeptidase regulatory-like domain-containing protein [Planctomycetota bacterium]